ncbi:isochorismate synthase [Bacillus suaedaesalsae]|uniref:Isochorismate synthase MenF n=1 Tax=Bacillus suaedaesalsae TaxID=2810349 RepID=A0ABS2DHT6_9BACI|nr:isochorismate synthase [Bacillus suaedaesalsae]MBM6618050.1 isochorismate synthase [Bacillus suaedaesalsae]
MATIQKRSIYDNIVDGINRAKEKATPILVSLTTEITDIDPLLFYMAGKELFTGEGVYWKEPVNGETIVGLGVLQTIQSNKNSNKRFQDIKEQWNCFLENMIHTNITESKHARGPILFGGFSFDPTKAKTELWSDFPSAQFYLSKYTLNQIDNQLFLTSNRLVKPLDHVETVINEMECDEKQLYVALKKMKRNSIHDPSYKEREIDVENWLNSVETVVTHINEGKLEKAVLARELKLEADEPFSIQAILQNLVMKQPTSYIFAIDSGVSTFIGATPERLIKKDNQQLLSTCLAGSIKRGSTIEEDLQLANELLEDPKNLAEHQFVVDMITKELKSVCRAISKPDNPTIFKARDIQHLYTPIVGEVKDHVHLFEIVERLHPTPALGGFPQDKALEEIRTYEQLDRGWYAGPIGWMDGDGNGEFAVAIRSALFKQHEASLFAGCGIVAKSEASKEYEETMIKFKPMLNAIGGKLNGR